MAFNIAQPLAYTLLSRPTYAQVMGINPVHFAGAFAQDIMPIGHNSQNDIWPKYPWQSSDRIAQQDLVVAINSAEKDVSNYLGYWPAPDWSAQEVHRIQRHHRRDVWRAGMRNLRYNQIAVRAKHGKVITPGRRAVSVVGGGPATVAAGSLEYRDEDLDGFFETAKIELSTTLTDTCEIKVYFVDTDADRRWEVRPLRSVSISLGVVTIYLDSWLLIDPDLQSAYTTTAGFSAIDISTTANFVTEVDVYREYTSTIVDSSLFFWEPTPRQSPFLCSTCGGAGCVNCQLQTQGGCLHIREAEQGIVVPMPATYDADDAEWDYNCPTLCRNPEQVQIWYKSGLLSDEYLNGYVCTEMPLDMATAIAWIATARLERPFCAGTNLTALCKRLRRDTAVTGQQGFQLTNDDLANPFGTRVGEIMAWRKIGNLVENNLVGVAI